MKVKAFFHPSCSSDDKYYLFSKHFFKTVFVLLTLLDWKIKKTVNYSFSPHHKYNLSPTLAKNFPFPITFSYRRHNVVTMGSILIYLLLSQS